MTAGNQNRANTVVPTLCFYGQTVGTPKNISQRLKRFPISALRKMIVKFLRVKSLAVLNIRIDGDYQSQVVVSLRGLDTIQKHSNGADDIQSLLAIVKNTSLLLKPIVFLMSEPMQVYIIYVRQWRFFKKKLNVKVLVQFETVLQDKEITFKPDLQAKYGIMVFNKKKNKNP